MHSRMPLLSGLVIASVTVLCAPASEFTEERLLGLDLPELPEGLLLDPDATMETIAAHHAATPVSDLVRTKFRLDAWLQVVTREFDPSALDPMDVRDPSTRHFFLYRDAALKEQLWMNVERSQWHERNLPGPLPVRASDPENRWPDLVAGKRVEDLVVMASEVYASFATTRLRERDRMVALGRYTAKPHESYG